MNTEYFDLSNGITRQCNSIDVSSSHADIPSPSEYDHIF